MKAKKMKQILAGMLTAAMLIGLMPTGMTTVRAEEMPESMSSVMVNPLYADSVTVQEVQEEFAPVYDAAVKSCNNIAAAGKYICEQMVNRATSISFTLPSSEYSKYANNFLGALVDEATKIENDTYKGRGGDALKFGYKGMGISMSTTSTSVTVNLTVTYYTSAAQEAALTQAVNTAMAEMKLDQVADPYEDIKIIHDYICNHVDYDWNYSKYSAYDALCTGTSVCQGYAILFYRLCSEAGYPVRIISGIGNSQAHAWNIVKVNGKYYNVDCTWDGQESNITRDSYLLKNEIDFPNHTRDEEYTTWNFLNAHPMAEESYLKLTDAALNTANPSYNFQTIQGGTVSSAANGKAKLIMLISTGCWNSQNAVSSVANTDMGNVDVLVVDTNKNSLANVTQFKNTYGNDKMTFSYDTGSNNSNALWNYVRIGGYGNSATWPVLAYIDANNKVQNVTMGPISAGEIKSRLAHYCGQTFNGVVGVEELYFMQNKVELNAGDEYQLEVCMNPTNATIKQQTYESSNTSVATVSATGKVKAVAGGTTTVTAIVVDQNNKVLKTQCTIVVKGASSNTNNNTNNNTVDKNFTGLKNEGGIWYYYENGVKNSKKHAMVDYGGSKFLVADGRMVSEKSGLAQDPVNKSDWYYLANGQAQLQYTGLAQYNGAWFYVNEGKLDTTLKGYVEYDGGLFYVAAGQIKKEVSGLAQDPNTGKWYYLASGQVQLQYTGLAKYDGEWFYVIDGALAEDYTGYVKYDGSKFYVVNGMLQL